MKKTLALILAIVMVFALSTSAFAATDIVGTLNEDRAKNPSTAGVNSGATSANGAYNNAILEISATQGDVEHRYAVDIEHDTLLFQITGSNMVWNVDKLEYEPKAQGGDGKPTQTTFNVTVTNYSDVAVALTVGITDKDPDDLVEVVTNLQNDAATIGSAVGTTAGTECPFTVSVVLEDPQTKTWTDAINYFTKYFDDNPLEEKKLIATLSVGISAVAPANND